MQRHNLDESLLPKVLQDFVALIGLPATMKIIEAYGGTRLYIPKTFKPDHILVVLIGAEATIKLIEVYGGEDHFDIPKADGAARAVRNAKIRESAKSQRILALEYNLTERQIRTIQNTAQGEDLQVGLF